MGRYIYTHTYNLTRRSRKDVEKKQSKKDKQNPQDGLTEGVYVCVCVYEDLINILKETENIFLYQQQKKIITSP